MKKYIWTGAIILIVAAAAVYSYAKSHPKASYTIAYTVATQDVRQTVLATGTVTSQSNLNLAFKNSGNLSKLRVQVGDHVKTGQVLAVLDQKEAQASINQAQASLLAAQANYNKVIAGASSQDVDVAKAALTSAQVTLNNSKTTYANVVTQQQVAVNNAYATMLNSGLAAIPGSTNVSTATVTVSGTYNSTVTGSYVITANNSANGPIISVNGLELVPQLNIFRGTPQQLGVRGLSIIFSTTGSIQPGDTWTITIPNTQASSYLANYNAYQAALQAQVQAVANAQGAVDSAQAAVAQAQAQLALKQAAARPEDVQAAQAQIDTARAQLQAAQNNYDNNIIVAPIDGVVTSVDAKLGEVVMAQKEALVLLDQTSLHVESDISESSITDVHPGQAIDMTLDAFGPDKHFNGEVLSIDPASTVVQGVINYRVLSSIPKTTGTASGDNAIKPGMTVNLVITIADKPGVIAVPNRLIKTNGNIKTVALLQNGHPADVPISVGLVGDNYAEVVSGLSVGDQIVTVKTK